MASPTQHLAADAKNKNSPIWLLAVAAVLTLVFEIHGPVPQWAGYHAFADARSWAGLPNVENVLSNLPFALIGLWGLSSLARPADPVGRAWQCFSAALICTAFGSAVYHWAPYNWTLVFDRLPIAWACASLLCAFLAERVDIRWANAQAIVASLVMASASVAWWWFTEQSGHGDLRAYLWVQFLPMLIVPTAICLGLRRVDRPTVANGVWWSVLGLYAMAKLMEIADQPIYGLLGFTSGHTLKHLLAAAAALCLLRGVRRAEISCGSPR
jgi:hypothetical protein